MHTGVACLDGWDKNPLDSVWEEIPLDQTHILWGEITWITNTKNSLDAILFNKHK